MKKRKLSRLQLRRILLKEASLITEAVSTVGSDNPVLKGDYPKVRVPGQFDFDGVPSGVIDYFAKLQNSINEVLEVYANAIMMLKIAQDANTGTIDDLQDETAAVEDENMDKELGGQRNPFGLKENLKRIMNINESIGDPSDLYGKMSITDPELYNDPNAINL